MIGNLAGNASAFPAFYGLPRWNNYLDTLAYGNGDSVQYTYDDKGRVTKQTYEDGDTVTYTYDAWGNVLSMGGSKASTLGVLNPLRYRGYVYDTETELYYLQSRYYNPEMGRFINADGLVSTGQGFLGNNMFAYCGNNPIIRLDFDGELWGVVGLIVTVVVVALTCTSSQNQGPYFAQQAKEKYNSSNVSVYERDNPPTNKGNVNAEIYYPNEATSNINIDNLLGITSGYEQDAVLDVIIESPYYNENTYGSKSFMKAQWIAHNACYDIAASGSIGFWIMQQLSGSDNPIQSSLSLDLRSLNNMLRRQRWLYTVISWVC